MPVETRLLISLAIASAIVYWATPVAIRIAARLEFYDRPAGYKGHARPTPYLGGAAVTAGFMVAVLLLGGSWDRTLPLLGGVAVLWVVGTVDDRRTVHPAARVAVELALAGMLWAAGLGWDLHAGPVLDLAVTAFWIVAVVNAFNLFDNMDGAASSMAAVVSGGLAVYGVATGNSWLAVCAVALCGACLGFLPHNLFASPARIFLGDGGSLPIGFAVAGLAMAGVSDAALPWQSLAMGLLFVGIPALDTTLVMVSRRRRGRSIMTGGRDHLTHRTRSHLRTARAVAFALGGAQAIVSALAVVAVRGGPGLIVGAVVAYLVAAGVAIAALDARFEPATAGSAASGAGAGTPPGLAGGVRPDWASWALLVPLATGIGVSPFFGGFYRSGLWVPIGLVLVAVAAGLLIARPFRLTRPAALVVTGLGGLAVWSLVSAAWSDSVEDAQVAGNRWLVYLVLTLVILAAVRTPRAALALFGLLAAAALVVAGTVTAWLLGSDPLHPFLGLRLHEPLGYINGEGAFFVLAAWPCLAAAEQRRSALLSGAGFAGAVLLAALAVLSQSRGVALGALVSAVVVLAVVPGRARRAWTLIALGAVLALVVPTLTDVYGAAGDPASIRDAMRQVLIAAVAGGAAWGVLSLVSLRVERAVSWTARAAAALVATALVLACLAAIVSAPTIGRNVSDQYHAFVRLESGSGESSRLLSGAGNRYDYWRVAWSTFRSHPVAGVGAGNYPVPYFRERSTTEDVRQPHSLALQTLSELGLVGAALLALLLAGVAWGAARTARAARRSPTARTLAVAGTGVTVAWLVNTGVDWQHLIPGVTAMALAAAVVLIRTEVPSRATDAAAPQRAGVTDPRRAAAHGLATDARHAAPHSAATDPHRPHASHAAGSRRRLALAGVAALVLALAGLTLSRQGLAERYRFAAQNALAGDPARALTEADRSLRIDPHALDAYYVKAAALARFNQGPAAVATLEAATRRAPGSFVTWALLGDLHLRMGDAARAQAAYGRAHTLNPRDETLAAAAAPEAGS